MYFIIFLNADEYIIIIPQYLRVCRKMSEERSEKVLQILKDAKEPLLTSEIQEILRREYGCKASKDSILRDLKHLKKLEKVCTALKKSKNAWIYCEYKQKDEIPIPVLIERTKRTQEKVIKPLLEWFEHVNYGWILNFKGIREYAKYGAPYMVIKNFKEGMISLDLIVKSTYLLEEFRKNHAPKLFKLIEEFDKTYAEYWQTYYKIHDKIRNIIYKVANLPIIDHDAILLRKGLNELHIEEQEIDISKIDCVTTNLQYLLFYMLKANELKFSSIKEGAKVIQEENLYEFWFGGECLIREKIRGRTKGQFFEKWLQEIEIIFQEINKSKDLFSLSKKLQSLEERLLHLQATIVKNLRIHLDMEILKPANEEKIIEAEGFGACVERDGKWHPIVY